MAKRIVFFDTEVGDDNRIHDIGAVMDGYAAFHSASVTGLIGYLREADYICGHNIIRHDIPYIEKSVKAKLQTPTIDTLVLSPLVFPHQAHHALLKDDKLLTDELNNPINDSEKARKLFFDEVNAFNSLPSPLKQIYYILLNTREEFHAFFDFIGYRLPLLHSSCQNLIRGNFTGKLCTNANLNSLVQEHPIELAYILAFLQADEPQSVMPAWLTYNYPQITGILHQLRGTPCSDGCSYCKQAFSIKRALKQYFNYDEFRRFGGESLQENTVQAAVDGKSLLGIFPTGGGKSLTFQLPALMAAEMERGLTVVITPLQSLMKDQVDNLEKRGITSAVTINGMLNPIERSTALARVRDSSAHLLYISPEQLRTRRTERMLAARNVVRFVIDEAHCFSAWGQDFRVDYQYIGKFIRKLQEKKGPGTRIPVSCFTATAKQKVISDIRDYFRAELDLDLELYATSTTRENLHYSVIHCDSDDQKYTMLRNLISRKSCATIVYVSRTKRTRELAERLTRDGYPALPYHGKMEPNAKIANQEAFISGEVNIIVATSAFGMGVDKDNVELVIHYDISSSLEDYVQEAGRAGRNPNLEADCYVLYNDDDLNKHFILLNQQKLSISEIQQVWKAVKDLSKHGTTLYCSSYEIAQQAGWNDGPDATLVDTRVKTALQALENAGYIRRGQNLSNIYATGVISPNVKEAVEIIDTAENTSEKDRETAKRIINSIISESYQARAKTRAEFTQVDYLADILGLPKEDVIHGVNLLRELKVLDDYQDMTGRFSSTNSEKKSTNVLDQFVALERHLFMQITEGSTDLRLKQLNESAQEAGIARITVKSIRRLLNFLAIKHYIKKSEYAHSDNVSICLLGNLKDLTARAEVRVDIAYFALDYLYQLAGSVEANEKGDKAVEFSLVKLFNDYKSTPRLLSTAEHVDILDVEEALYYLTKIGALQIEGGFLVLYNRLEINRLVTDNRIKYKVEDYKLLDSYYQQKIQQIHIVGEYANMMLKNQAAAQQYVSDYFLMDYKAFIDKYFKGSRKSEITRNLTPEKYEELFGTLSETQKKIISDKNSQYIVVAAGPGSGKTRVLVHKLAALLLMEDVKHDQLLMLTFSRAAATEFKKRLIELVGNAANFVDIMTFHSYCFDLLGKVGKLDNLDHIIEDAAKMIIDGEVEQSKIAKSVLVIDEAQDMSGRDFALVQAIIEKNEDMRVIAVGDDDQNIFEFAGADPKYMKALVQEYHATQYEMAENYRSQSAVVRFANEFAKLIRDRMKSSPGIAVQEGAGNIWIMHHKGSNFVQALAMDVARFHKDETSCILTQTNEEAVQLLGLLSKQGIHAKLIQSLGKTFRLSDLAEIRYFLNLIDKKSNSVVIPEHIWNEAKDEFNQMFEKSSCLDNCIRMIADFETVYPERFRSDLEEFIRESQYEDFYEQEQGALYISTIHKAKGREFDNVFLLLQNCIINTMKPAEAEALKRRIYVGLTRAKSSLFIHCNTDIFDSINIPTVKHIYDSASYPEPDELLIQMGHRDIYLDYSKEEDRQNTIRRLRSGKTLSVQKDTLYVEKGGVFQPIAYFSKSFREQLAKLKVKGYLPTAALLQFIVIWKDEYYIPLPTLILRKQ